MKKGWGKMNPIFKHTELLTPIAQWTHKYSYIIIIFASFLQTIDFILYIRDTAYINDIFKHT